MVNFLETESLASTDTSEPTRTLDEQRAEDHFLQTHPRQPDGRYVIQLPQKMDPPALGCSSERALWRHHQNSASLTRKGKFKEFQDALWDYARRNHAERVPQQDLLKPESEGYYLPTHAVFKESTTTTKLRVIFNASASTTSGSSLNDQLLAGPNLYPQLVPILINFRSYVVGMTADIGKMFREIALRPLRERRPPVSSDRRERPDRGLEDEAPHLRGHLLSFSGYPSPPTRCQSLQRRVPQGLRHHPSPSLCG